MSVQRFLRGHRSDDGVTLVIAMMVMGVVISLSVLVLTVAISSNQQSGRDRQRTVAVNAAEAALDASFATIQASGTTLPCTWPASGTEAVNASPDRATARATITYFKANGAPLGHCPTSADVGANAPATAMVDGYGATNQLAATPNKTRHMQSLINVTPVYGNSLNKAIFADGNLALNNQTTLTGNNGPDADVYTNNNFVCANNQNFAGSVHAQGTITVQGSCTIAGDAWAKGNVTNSSGANGSIGGRVLSSTGTITLPNNFSVNGSLLAAGNISWGGCSASGKCFPNTTVANPQFYPMPILRGDSATMATWTAQGYTVVDDNVCGSSPNFQTIKDKIIGTYARTGTKTLVRTTCPVKFKSDHDIALFNDLAIFAYGGLSSSQQVSFVSSNGTARNLHWVVPYDAVASRPCTSPGITTDNQFNFATEVNMLVYSPCNIAFSNNSDHLGQIFGGSAVSINNQFTMPFRPVPVWGIDPTSLPLLSYKIDIVYKRESR
jgi:Tfp pilus assembly protein PilX